LKVETIQGIKA